MRATVAGEGVEEDEGGSESASVSGDERERRVLVMMNEMHDIEWRMCGSMEVVPWRR